MDGARETRRRRRTFLAFGRIAGGHAGRAGDAGLAGSQRRVAAAQLLDLRKPDGQRVLRQPGHPRGICRAHAFRAWRFIDCCTACWAACLAWAVRDRVARIRVLLVSVAFALIWYYLSYRILWRAMAPLIALLHVERATVLGHLVYGTLLARYPVYLPQPAAPAMPASSPAEAPSEPAVGSESV